MTLPSILTTGVNSPIVPVVKTSWALWNSANEIRRTSVRICNSSANSNTALRVIPGKQWSAWGVKSVPCSSTINKFVAFVSLTYPSISNIMASATPAKLACSLGNILLIKLLWCIFESTQDGGLRRCDAVMRDIPVVLSYVVTPWTGFHSGNIMRVVPYTLKFGFILDVHFSPRVNVNRICAPSLILFTASTWKIASVICSLECMYCILNPNALALFINRFKCFSRHNIVPRYTRIPSHVASPPCTTESKGDTPAISRGIHCPYPGLLPI